MNTYVAVLVLGVMYVVGGFGVLALVGLVPQRRSAPLWVDVAKLGGVAYLTGLAATSMILIAMACVGFPISTALAVGVSAALAACGVARTIRRSSSLSTPPRGAWHDRNALEYGIVTVLVVLTVAYAGLGVRWAAAYPLSGSWDAWAMWLIKGHLIYSDGHLPTQFLTSSAYHYFHANYPMLVPVMNALWFHIAGYNSVALHSEYWALLIATLWAAGYVATRRSRPLVVIPVVVAIAVINQVWGQLMSLYADIPMALLLFLAVVCLGDWLADSMQSDTLWLGIIFLAAAANTKDEGLTGALAALIALWVGLAISKPGRGAVLRLGLGTAGFVVAIAPWQLWLAAHHVAGDVPVGKGLDPSYVLGRMDRFMPSLTAFYQNATNSAWLHALPLAMFLVMVCICAGRVRRLAVFYFLAGLLNVIAILWTYVISTNPLAWYLSTSAGRVIDGLLFVSFAAIVVLTGELWTPDVSVSDLVPIVRLLKPHRAR